MQSIFNQPKEKKEFKSDVKRKELETVLSLQRRHPILDRILMLAGICAFFIVSIPFIYIGFQMSLLNNIGGNKVISTITESFGELADAKKIYKWVPVFQLPWEQSGWLFETIGTLMLLGIIVGLIILAIIYARDLVTIIKSIGILLRKNVESTIEVVKEQTEDSKKIAIGTTVLAQEPKKEKPTKKGKKQKSTDPEDVEVEKAIEEIKKQYTLEAEKKDEPQQEEVKKEEPEVQEVKSDIPDLTKMSDTELNKYLNK